MRVFPRADQDAGTWLLARLRQLAALAIADSARVPRHAPGAVHALRVRMKKLRALLDLAAGREDQRGRIRNLRQACRTIKASLTASRESEVLERLCQKWLGHPLEMEHRDDAAAAGSPPDLSDRLARLQAGLHALDLAELTWEDILSRHARSWRRSRKAMRACRDGDSVEALHAWRKRVKQLHYQSLALSRLPGARRRIRRAGKLADLLGKDHDLSMLAARVDLSRERPDAVRRLLARQESLRRKIFKLGSRLRLRRRHLGVLPG